MNKQVTWITISLKLHPTYFLNHSTKYEKKKKKDLILQKKKRGHLYHTDTIFPVPLQVPQVLSILNMPACTNN